MHFHLNQQVTQERCNKPNCSDTHIKKAKGVLRSTCLATLIYTYGLQQDCPGKSLLYPQVFTWSTHVFSPFPPLSRLCHHGLKCGPLQPPALFSKPLSTSIYEGLCSFQKCTQKGSWNGWILASSWKMILSPVISVPGIFIKWGPFDFSICAAKVRIRHWQPKLNKQVFSKCKK